MADKKESIQLENKTLLCVECANLFVFTAGEHRRNTRGMPRSTGKHPGYPEICSPVTRRAAKVTLEVLTDGRLVQTIA